VDKMVEWIFVLIPVFFLYIVMIAIIILGASIIILIPLMVIKLYEEEVITILAKMRKMRLKK